MKPVFARMACSLAAIALPLSAPMPLAAKARTAPAGAFSAEELARLDAAMDGFVDRGELAGIATLLIHRDREIAFHAHGERNAATHAPLTRDTIFRIYSMTKPVTAVALLILYEQGKWKLDDPITRFLPEMADLKVVTGETADGKPILANADRPPTMRELMSHTGGFAYGMMDGRLASTLFRQRNVAAAPSVKAMVDMVAALPLLSQPGSEWAYSISSDLQGVIVERISGQSLGAFMKQHIFDPLAMRDTGFTVPAHGMARLVDLYATDPASGKPVPVMATPAAIAARLVRDYGEAPKVESGGGGLVSTIDDYARFARMLARGGTLDGHRILKRETVALMGTNQIPTIAFGKPNANKIAFGPALGYGLGVMVATDPHSAGMPDGKGTISWDGAASTWFWVDPANDIVFVGMVQRMGGPVRLQLEAQSRELVYDALRK